MSMLSALIRRRCMSIEQKKKISLEKVDKVVFMNEKVVQVSL